MKKLFLKITSAACAAVMAFSFAACGPDDGPGTAPEQLDAPQISLDENVISWSAIVNASGYTVYLEDSAAGTVESTSYTISITEPGSYDFYVVAESDDENYAASERSNTVTYTVEEPDPEPVQLEAPQISLDGNILSWSAVENATEYTIYQNGNAVESITGTSYVIPVTAPGSYAYAVIATSTDADYTASEQSNEVTYTVEKPEPVKLSAPHIALNGATLSWSAVENAAGYTIYQGGSAVAGVTGTSYTIDITEPGVYTFTVIATSDNENYTQSDSSNAVTYIVEEPEEPDPEPVRLEAPEIALSGNVISWSAVENATGYTVYQGGNAVTSVTGTSYSISINTPGSYSFTVVATSTKEGYAASAHSNSVTYVVAEPEPVQLEAPGLTLSGNRLSWRAIDGATGYTVYVNGVFEAETTGTAYTIPHTAPGNYTYTVIAEGDGKNFTDSEQSAGVTYTVAEELPEEGLSEGITYQYGGNESAALEWDTANSRTQKVEYKLSAASSYTSVDDELIRTVGTDTDRADILGLEGGRTYDFRVTLADGQQFTAEGVAVAAYDRSGYAHFKYSDGVGAYNDDGTLKDGAIVIYVTESTKNTVTATFGGRTYTGIAEILKNLSRADAPVAVRIIGRIAAATWNKIDYNADKKYNSSNKLPADKVVGINGKALPQQNLTQEDIIAGGYNTLNTAVCSELEGLSNRIKYSSGEFDSAYNNCSIDSAENITLEGVGEGAEIFQWGLTWSKCNSIEVRNITFDDYTEDACSFEGGTESETIDGFDSNNLWIHHNTFNEGINYWDVTAEQDKHEGDGATDLKRAAYITISYNHYYKNHKTGLVGGGDNQTTACITFHHNWYEDCSSRLPLGRQANMHMYNNYYDGSTSYDMSLRANAYAFVENCYFEDSNDPMQTQSGAVIKAYGCIFDGCAVNSKYDVTIATSRTQVVENNNVFAPDFDTNSEVFYFANGKTDVENMLTASEVKAQVPRLAGALGDERKPDGGSGESGNEPSTPSVTDTVTYIPKNDGLYGNGGAITVTYKADKEPAYKQGVDEVTINGVTIGSNEALKVDSGPTISFDLTGEMTLTLYLTVGTIKVDDTTYDVTDTANGCFKFTMVLGAGGHTISRGSAETALYYMMLN